MQNSILIGIAVVIIIAGVVNAIASFAGYGILYKFANTDDIGYDIMLGFGTLAFGVTMLNNIG
jgi:hypothetical protein